MLKAIISLIEEEAMLLSVFHHRILQFSLSLSQFQPIFMSFIAVSFVLSLFQGHVACLNFTLTGRQG